MRFSLFLTCLFLILFQFTAQAQQVRYTIDGKSLMTPAAVDTLLADMNRQAAQTPLRMIFRKNVVDSTQRGDTLVYVFKLQGAPRRAGTKEAAQYEVFIGKPLLAFALPELSGKLLDSRSLLGRPLVINMWFTTCTPCIAEMPALNRIQAANRQTQFLAMTFEAPAKVQAFLQRRTFTFRHIPAARTYCEQFTNSYPISIFVDKQGIVRRVLSGMSLKLDNLAATDNPANAPADDTEFLAALRQIQ
ncbi:MAG: TlpA family protein disulfide reductase [Janthinobacterium lividum]